MSEELKPSQPAPVASGAATDSSNNALPSSTPPPSFDIQEDNSSFPTPNRDFEKRKEILPQLEDKAAANQVNAALADLAVEHEADAGGNKPVPTPSGDDALPNTFGLNQEEIVIEEDAQLQEV